MSALTRREKKFSLNRKMVDKKVSNRKIEIMIANELADGRMFEMNDNREGNKGIRVGGASPA